MLFVDFDAGGEGDDDKMIRVGTDCIEKSEAGVRQVVNQDHLHQD